MGTNLTLTNLNSGFNTDDSLNADLAAIKVAISRCLNLYGDDDTGDNQIRIDIDMNSQQLINLAAPTLSSHAVTLAYANANLGGAAKIAAEAAQVAAEAAQAGAEAAETNAAASEVAAALSESNAATSETNAAASELAAGISESNAAASESAAATSESNAAASEAAAASSESNAATSESNALASENNAAASESNAATSETNAATSESNAATSETNAAASESAASTSESNAAASEAKAAAWAEEAEDVEVETGQFSAYHWAQKAAAFSGDGYFLDSASFIGKSHSVTTEDTNPQGVFFKPDGTSMFVVGNTNDTVYQYTLSTPWDVSTASYASKSHSVASEETGPTGVFFKSNGTSMFVVGVANNTVYQYTLSTPWDVSTASYASKSHSVASEETSSRGVFFKPDGTSMFVVGTTNDTVYQYTLSTPWDVSTASYASKSHSVASEETSPQGVFFRPDGTSMFVVGTVHATVYEYILSTPWDVSTASYASKSHNITAEETSPTGVFFKPDGISMFVVGSGNGVVYQYDTYSRGTVRISANDTTPEYLDTKLVAGGTVELTETNDGANESLLVTNNIQLKFKTADEIRSSSSTLTDDSDLAGFALEADTMYKISGVIYFNGGSTPDYKAGFALDNAAQYGRVRWSVASSLATTLYGDVSELITSPITGIPVTVGFVYAMTIDGVVHGHATLASVLDFQWAQDVSDAASTNTNKGSWLQVEKLGVA